MATTPKSEETDEYATGGEGQAAGGEGTFGSYENASYSGPQVLYTGGNGATVEQSNYGETDHSVLDNQQYQLDAATEALIVELKNELTKLDPEANKHAIRLINWEIERLSTYLEPEYLEVDVPKPIRIVKKILVPVHRNPKFNFVGKLLGPGGKTLQSLIQTTRCRIYILGRGSSRDKAKEEELLASGDAKYAHMKDPLYIRVESSGPAAVAYQKIASVLNELQYYLQPVRDEIYMQQMADMGKTVLPPGPMAHPTRGPMRGGLMGTRPPMRGGPRGFGPPVRPRGYLMQTPPAAAAAQPGAAPATTGPPNYVSYPGYDYSNYGEYQQSGTPAQPAAPYGHVQAPSAGLPAPPIGPSVPSAPSGQAQAPPPPPPNNYATSSPYSYGYGYDYSQQYASHGGVATQAPPIRPPGPMPAPGGGKMPSMGRGRGMPRPGPY